MSWTHVPSPSPARLSAGVVGKFIVAAVLLFGFGLFAWVAA